MPPIPAKQAAKPVSELARILFVLAGAVVFIGLNFVLFIGRCRSSEFMLNCSGDEGTNTIEVLVAGGVLGIAAIVSRRGRSFALGFGGALLALGVVSTGSCTRVWVDPYYSVKHKVAPYQAKRELDRTRDEARRKWIAEMNTRPMDIGRGVALAGRIVICAQSYEKRTGRTAMSDTELAEHCDTTVRELWARVEADYPLRYKIPVARGFHVLSEPVAEERGDAGWRITYAPTPTGYAIGIVPDADLDRQWPRIHADSDLRFEVNTSESAASMPITPLPDVGMMVRCLKGIPAEEARRNGGRSGPSYGWHLTSMAGRVCPELKPRLRALQPADSNATRLSVMLPVGAEGTAVEVAIFKVQIVLKSSPGEPFAFDLIVDPTSWGLPHYFVSDDGVVHWTKEARSATIADPPLPK